jgi:hypothetical protein
VGLFSRVGPALASRIEAGLLCGGESEALSHASWGSEVGSVPSSLSASAGRATPELEENRRLMKEDNMLSTAWRD